MIIIVVLEIFVNIAIAYDCKEIQHNGIAQLISCQMNNPPLPLDWEFQFILKYAYYWNGVDQIKAQYFGSEGEVKANCSTAATEPGGYSHFWHVMFRQVCYQFEPEPLYTIFTVFATYKDPIILNATIPSSVTSHKNNLLQDKLS